MKPLQKIFLLALPVLILLSSTSCKKTAANEESSSTGSSDKPTANVVKGTIRDAQGNPLHITGAKVVVTMWGVGANGDDATYAARMDEHSHYEVKVSQGAYQMRARLYAPLNGNTICIDLVPLDSKPDNEMQESQPGIVRDYGLQLTGLIPGRDPNSVGSYAGAQLSLTDGARNFTDNGYWENIASRYPGASVHAVLTPKGPLVDGSQGEAVSLTCKVEDIQTTYYFWNFPLAAYELSGTLTTADGQQLPLLFSVIPNLNPATTVTLLYEPNKDDNDGHPVIPNIAVWVN